MWLSFLNVRLVVIEKKWEEHFTNAICIMEIVRGQVQAGKSGCRKPNG
tara:strand:- start:5949 stop:6092 length:144 start_codon:yes stop_codon:yes gene_type:complete